MNPPTGVDRGITGITWRKSHANKIIAPQINYTQDYLQDLGKFSFIRYFRVFAPKDSFLSNVIGLN
jgi:hypothetical protein